MFRGQEIATAVGAWVILVVISSIAGSLIWKVFDAHSWRSEERRVPLLIAMILAGMLAVVLIQVPRDELPLQGLEGWSRYSVLVALFVAGWVTWYLRHIPNYGEFIYVFLLTELTCLSWYARFVGPDMLQLAIAVYIAGSLLHMAHVMLHDHEKQGHL